MLVTARATRARSSPSATSSAGRTSSSSTATRSCSTTRGGRRPGARLRRAPPRLRRRARAGDGQAVSRRAQTRARPLPRDGAASRVVELQELPERAEACRARTPFEPSSSNAARPHARPPRLAVEERVRRGRRGLRGHRLGGYGRALRRRARRRARPLRLDAVALQLRRDDVRRAPARRGPRLRHPRDRIEDVVQAFHDSLGTDGRARGLAAENLQACSRVLLMALSNTHGWLVVSTGNKSELAVGYSTLYGDMVGGFSLLKDVFKTDVFRLARHLNESAGRELCRSRRSSGRRAPSSGRPARR